MAKITMATVKSFIRKNEGKLYIRTKSSFDGMVDGVRDCPDRDWSLALAPDAGHNHSNQLGIHGAWFVGGSRDYLQPITDGEFTGFHVYNCCGSFDLAVRAV